MKYEKKRPKPCLILIVLLLLTGFIGGCGSDAALFGGGMVAGTAMQNTVLGAKQDVAVYKASLQEQYAKAVAEGAPQETLDRIELSIKRTEQVETVVDTGEKAIQTDWTDPEAVGGWIGLAVSTLIGLMLKKKLNTTTLKYDAHKAGVDKTIREEAPKITEVNLGTTLYDNIGEARLKLGI